MTKIVVLGAVELFALPCVVTSLSFTCIVCTGMPS